MVVQHEVAWWLPPSDLASFACMNRGTSSLCREAMTYWRQHRRDVAHSSHVETQVLDQALVGMVRALLRYEGLRGRHTLIGGQTPPGRVVTSMVGKVMCGDNLSLFGRRAARVLKVLALYRRAGYNLLRANRQGQVILAEFDQAVQLYYRVYAHHHRERTDRLRDQMLRFRSQLAVLLGRQSPPNGA